MDYKNEIDKLRHSCSHVMAQAVKELWPETKVAIGPAITEGFYYDFDKREPFTDQDLAKIEKRMRKIIDRNPSITQKFLSRNEAVKMFTGRKEDYKLELISEIPDEKISIYEIEKGFVDLCKGPHVENIGEIKAFKLLSVAGAYWRGDENKAQLQRIYGTCFKTKEELDEYLNFLEEAKKRDHRKLGVQLDLFNFYYEEAGAGLVFYHPPGAMLRKLLEDYIREQNINHGYDLVMTPNILKGKLWETSGHADYYKENMYFFKADEEEYAVKPMNCPGHILIYKSKVRSYRDLPVRFFELGTVYRKEKAGVLHGLLRVRGFTQDDAHIFCRENQIKDEVKKVIDFIFELMKDFGFNDIKIELSTRPEDFIGKIEEWDKATQALKDSLEEKGLEYQINEGDGAFYGPKIDIKLRDALKREWQCATIQCDFSLPDRFNITYINEKGGQSRTIMIHRAILGSVERFVGTLIEHYAGAFPLWLAPTQVLIVPIRENHFDYCNKLKETFHKNNIRTIIDNRNESLNKRIREGTIKKVPYLLIIGDKEVADKKVSIREYGEGDTGSLSADDFINKIKQEVKTKKKKV